MEYDNIAVGHRCERLALRCVRVETPYCHRFGYRSRTVPISVSPQIGFLVSTTCRVARGRKAALPGAISEVSRWTALIGEWVGVAVGRVPFRPNMLVDIALGS